MLAGPLIAHLGVPSTTMAEQSVEGMTVNERLFHLGLHDQFDSAARSGNVPVMVQVLLRARFSEAQATHTAQTVATDPNGYGY